MTHSRCTLEAPVNPYPLTVETQIKVKLIPQKYFLTFAFSAPEKGVIAKGVFSVKESLESLRSMNFLESLEHGRILLSFPESVDSLRSLESLTSTPNVALAFAFVILKVTNPVKSIVSLRFGFCVNGN